MNTIVLYTTRASSSSSSRSYAKAAKASFFFMKQVHHNSYKMRTTTLTRAARMRITTTVKRMRHVVAFSGMNASFCDKKYRRHHRPTRRRSIGAVADQNHEGVNNARKKGAVLFLSFVPLSPETSAAGVRTRDLMEGFLKAGFSDVHYACASKMDEQENSESEQTVGGKRGKILRERDTESRGCV